MYCHTYSKSETGYQLSDNASFFLLQYATKMPQGAQESLPWETVSHFKGRPQDTRANCHILLI